MSSDEMTPAKWGLIGAAILAVVIAIGVVYRYARGPQPPMKTLGISKDDLMKHAVGAGSDSPVTGAGAESEVKSMKGPGATRPETKP